MTRPFLHGVELIEVGSQSVVLPPAPPPSPEPPPVIEDDFGFFQYLYWADAYNISWWSN